MITNALHAIASGVSYLLRARWGGGDQAYTDAQVLNTTAEGVETGSLTVVNTSTGTIKTVSGELEMTGDGGNSTLGLRETSGITKTIGTTVLVKTNHKATGVVTFGLNQAASIGNSSLRVELSGTGLKCSQTSTTTGNMGVVADATTYELAIIAGGSDASRQPYNTGDTKANFIYGASFYIKGGAFTTWTFLWHAYGINVSPIYPFIKQKNAISYLSDDFRLPDVDNSALQIPNNISTTVSTADTFTHIADFYLRVGITTLPTSGNLDIEFRRQDDTNKWIVRINSSGDISLVEVVAGTETTRAGPSTGKVVDGEEVVVITFGSTIYTYDSGIRRANYSSASNFQTDTGGKIVFPSGAIAYIADWKRDGYTEIASY